MPTFHIWTLGCQMNKADSLKLAAGLERLGHTAVDDDQNADLVVINTCAVRQHAEDRAFSRLGVLRKRRQRGAQFRLAVMGCMVGPRTEELERRFPGVDVWARPQQFDPILELAGAGRDPSEGEFWTETYGLPDSCPRLERIRHLVRESWGRITADTMKVILADHDGDPGGICRHGEGGSHSVTGYIAEPAAGLFHVRRGHGCTGTWTAYEV